MTNNYKYKFGRSCKKHESIKASTVAKKNHGILVKPNKTLKQARCKSRAIIRCEFLALSIFGTIAAFMFAGNTQKAQRNPAVNIPSSSQTKNILSPQFSCGDVAIESSVEGMGIEGKLRSLAKDKQSDTPRLDLTSSLRTPLSLVGRGEEGEVSRIFHSTENRHIKQSSRLQNHQDQAWSMAFSPNGEVFATASDDNLVKLWNSSTCELTATLEGHKSPVVNMAFNPIRVATPQGYSTILATASEDNTVNLWNTRTGELISTLSGHQSYAMTVAFSPDGQVLATAGWDNTIKLWNVSTGEVISTLKGHQGEIYSLAFSSDGNTLASASGDKTIKLWKFSTGELISTLISHQDAVTTLAFSGNGETLATASKDKTIKLWNINTNKLISTLKGHQSIVNSVAFNPYGNILASGSEDGTIKLWNVKTSQLISTSSKDQYGIWSVVFSPDGSTLASTNYDKALKFWDIAVFQPTMTLI